MVNLESWALQKAASSRNPFNQHESPRPSLTDWDRPDSYGRIMSLTQCNALGNASCEAAAPLTTAIMSPTSRHSDAVKLYGDPGLSESVD